MKLVGLISGGKDGIYNLISCIEYGHEVICLANLYPPPAKNTDELNSHMFQTVGHEAVEYIAQAMELPLIRHPLGGQSLIQSLHYETPNSVQNDTNDNSTSTEYDEIDDLYTLLSAVKKAHPDVQGVAAGAILSNYQRIRVERICSKLSLTCVSYLWQRDQVELLNEMCTSGKITPSLIKLATPNLPPQENLMKTLQELQKPLLSLYDQYGMNVCGEGGEYESLVIDSCLQSSSLSIPQYQIIDQNSIDPTGLQMTHLTVPYVQMGQIQLCPKGPEEISAQKRAVQRPVINLGCEASSPCGRGAACQCDSRPTPAPMVSIDTGVTQLPELAVQVEKHIVVMKKKIEGSSSLALSSSSSPLITRCSLRSADITALFSSYKLFVEEVKSTQGIAIRPVYVMICIPDMKSFGAMNAQYATVFPSIRPPARVCVQSALPYYTLDVIFIRTCDGEDREQEGCAQFQAEVKKCLKFQGNIDSCHVEGISTWAPANIGPYSQYWRLNGLFLGAGQIGMFPPTMALYSCITKQFLQTIKNSAACLQVASELHSLNAKNHVMLKNDLNLATTPSIGQFTSMLLTFDQNQVMNVIDAVLRGYSDTDTHGEKMSLLQKVELFLTIVNTLTAVPNTPVRSPNTQFDAIPLPKVDLSKVNGTFGTLLNSNIESHCKLTKTQREDEISTIITALSSPSAFSTFLPPVITTFDSDYTFPKDKSHGYDDYGYDDGEDADDEEYKRVNSSAVMVFVSAEMLPRGAAFELCSVGMTNHIFKALASRTSGSDLPSTLQKLRFVFQDVDENSQKTNIFVVFAIYIAGLYLDYAVFQLGDASSSRESLAAIPSALIQKIMGITGCSASNNSSTTSLNCVQSHLFLPQALFASPEQSLFQSLDPCTNLYPSSNLFDELNLNVAKLHIDSYQRLFKQKTKQIQAVSDVISSHLSQQGASDATTLPSADDMINNNDFFYPRPTVGAAKVCLCSVFPKLQGEEQPVIVTCPICSLNNVLNSNLTLLQTYHSLLIDPDLLTDLDTPDDNVVG